MVEDLIKRLRDTVEEEAGHGVRNEAADLIEQQAARIAALESERDALLNSLAAARQDASAAWERHAMATRIGNAAAGDLATARGLIADLEAERDALLAAAGKEAVAIYQVRRHEDEEKVWCDAYEATHYACSKHPEFYETRIVYTASPVQAVLTDERISEIIDEFDGCSWIDGELRIDCKEIMRLARTLLDAAPAAALEKGDGMSLRAQHEDACIAANNNAQDAERYRWLRTLDSDFGNRNRMSEMARFYGETLDEAIDAALSQNAGEK